MEHPPSLSGSDFLIVNGEKREWSPFPTTVAELLERLGLNPKTVVVEVEGAIVPRADFAARRLAPGMRVELVQFVGGG